jgi:hypothetical protein
MSLDVVDLRSFDAHPLGKVARRFVGVGIRRLWTGSKGLRILGIGYSTPYHLGLFREDAERCLAFMPATRSGHAVDCYSTTSCKLAHHMRGLFLHVIGGTFYIRGLDRLRRSRLR